MSNKPLWVPTQITRELKDMYKDMKKIFCKNGKRENK